MWHLKRFSTYIRRRPCGKTTRLRSFFKKVFFVVGRHKELQEFFSFIRKLKKVVNLFARSWKRGTFASTIINKQTHESNCNQQGPGRHRPL